jgi:hypothetical protein
LFFRLGTGVEHRTPPPLMSCNFTPFSCCFQLFYLVPSSDNTSRHDVISNAGRFFYQLWKPINATATIVFTSPPLHYFFSFGRAWSVSTIDG